MPLSRSFLLSLLALIFAIPALLAQPTSAVIPVVGSADGVNGSHFLTSLRLHNLSSSAATGKLVFVCPETESEQESIEYALAPHETKVYPDLIGAFGSKGLGSVDIRPVTGLTPLATATIEARAATSDKVFRVDEQSLDVSDVLTAGTTAALIAPDLERYRWNIGARTLDRGATLRILVHAAGGGVLRTLDRTFPPNYFFHAPADVFAGGAVAPGDSMEIFVADGSAILYGAATDNETQQPVLHTGQKIHYVHGSAGTSAQIIPTDNPAVMSTPWHGNASISRIGNVTIDAQQSVDFSVMPPKMLNTQVWTAANGDELRMNGVGVTLAPDAQGILNFEGLATITGGSGRFANATGAIRFEGGVNGSPLPGIGFFTITGTIELTGE